jgi:molecular chaperone GrpE
MAEREPDLRDDGTPPVETTDDGPQTTEAEGLPEEALRQDLDELVAKAGKAEEYLALAQRTQADFENYRKRMAREAAAAEGRGVARLAKELLPALDNLALALDAADQHGPDGSEGGHLAEGFRLVQAELTAALARAGIEAYSPKGEAFDPTCHEAMAQQPVEGAEPGTIVEVYQRGYRINDTILRPARVVVAA